MKTQVPLLICALIGSFMFVQYFVPATLPVYNRVTDYMQIIYAFSYILGIASVIQRHGGRLWRRGPERKRHKDWPYSVVVLVAMVTMIAVGLIWGRGRGTPFQTLFNSVLMPVQSTMFALLAFYLASASFRAFRIRSVDATVLLLAAIVVMIGRLDQATWLGIPWLSKMIMVGPNLVAKRAILIGIGLGMSSTALKIILGIERSYLASGRD